MKRLVQNNRKIFALYIIWVFIHLIILLMSRRWHEEIFWPFVNEPSDIFYYYDYSEFVAYGFGPLILIYAYNLFTKYD